MEIFRRDLPYREIYIIPIGDLHRGTKQFREEILDGYISWVKERPNAFILLGGDLGDYPTRASVTNPWEQTSHPKEQLRWEYEKFAPVADRVLGVVQGNHEYRVFDFSGFDPSMLLAERLGVPYGQYGIYLSLKLNTESTHKENTRCTLYATHGWGGARKAGAKVLKVEDLAHTVHANVYFLFHDHFISTHRIAYKIASDNHKEVVDYRKVLVTCGSCLDYGGYAQAKGYSPADLGFPRVRIEYRRVSGKSSYYDTHVSI